MVGNRGFPGKWTAGANYTDQGYLSENDTYRELSLARLLYPRQSQVPRRFTHALGNQYWDQFFVISTLLPFLRSQRTT